MADRISWREWSKKHALSLSEGFACLREAAFGGGRSSKAAAFLTGGAYILCVSTNAAKSGKSVSPKVGKRARTPLACLP